jgi:hypothetical protein
MSFEVCYDDPWLDSVAESSPQAPQFMEVTIAGRPYVLDTSFEPYRRDAFRHRSIQAQRESISLDNIPGEGTVNTEGLWRRLAQDWHFGAGQPYQDRKDSIDARFSISKGINPWMQWQVELLNDTKKVISLPGNARVVQCGGYVYVLDLTAQTVKFTSDLVNWTTVTGYGGVGLSAMTTDGYNLWIADSDPSAEGIYTTTAGAAKAFPYVSSQQFEGIWFVGDRLMATWGNNVYNITTIPLNVGTTTSAITNGSTVTSVAIGGGIQQNVAAGAVLTLSNVLGNLQVLVANAPATIGATSISVNSVTANANYDNGSTLTLIPGAGTPLWSHPNLAFRISSMCAGSSQIYIGGYVSATVPVQSTVYRTTIEATGTALTIPVQALPMEGGEYCTSLYGYLNFVFVGSNLGVRMCRTIAAFDPTGNEGDLEAGPLLPGLFPPGPVNSAVLTMVGNNRFMYFGWNNYDSVSTGLGRCDLSTFIDTQAPAFASDLMVTGQGIVTSMDWCTITNAPIFVVDGVGLYTAATTFVPSGYVTSGAIGYGIPDSKIVLAGNIGTVQPQSGTVSMALAADSNSNIFAFVGNQTPTSSSNSILPVNATRGDLFTVQTTLTRDPVTGQSPIMHRWMLKAIPAITAGTTVSVVIRMWQVEEIAGQDYFFDPYTEKAFLENLRTTQTVFAYTEGPLTYDYCTVDEIDWLPEKRWDASAYGGFVGDIIVYLKTYDLGA